jgi:FKBP-type peptidyl-prolyl cis-trans isomerase FkpA
MKCFPRGLAASLLCASLLAGGALPGAHAAEPANAPPASSSLATPRDRVSYAIGMDVGHSLAPIAPELDVAALEAALRNAFAGNKPVLPEGEAQAIDQALRARVAARNGAQAAPGAANAPIDKAKVGQMVGAYIVGRSLVPIKGEIELPRLMQGLRDTLGGRKPLLDDAQLKAELEAFGERMRTRMQAEAAASGAKNKAAGEAFLAQNKTVKGVFTTPSGLQYMVLRQGAGVRPRPADRVRVQYEGKLLDGKVFDSSYERGQAAEFSLDQVIPGWTEGVTLMPIGAKYRFWVPAKLGYGEHGTPDGQIGPNATLQFDVELLDILH